MRWVALLTAVALAGCGGQPTDGANESAPAATVAPAQVTLTSRGAPKRADGYWALKTVTASGTVMGTQFLCVGGDSEERAPLFDQIAMNVNCAKHEFTRTGEGWSFDTVCGPMNASTKGTITGDFVRSYRIALSENDGSMAMERTIEASRAGDCPAGAAPGDLNDESGKKIASTLP